MVNISAELLRDYLAGLESTGHNAGGRHAKYRAVRAFLNWWQREADPQGWRNPIERVRPPRLPVNIIEPVSEEAVQSLLDTCDDGFVGARDKAIILFLLDTGARARELLSIDLEDVDIVSGDVVIKKGKGGRTRTVFVGKNTRRVLRAYLRQREDDTPALWVTTKGGRLAFKSLQYMFYRRSKMAGIDPPSCHDFRRAYALSMLRAGVDVFSLQRLMGHRSLEVLRLYLAQTQDDLRAAHDKGSPVDNWRL